jgi:exopolyphosphatase/guanosine-5'-triphosphate,3'-diphosphate pyrophosphatase
MINAAYDVVKKYKEIADSYGVISLQAYATSASRDASNGGEFIKKAKEIADVDIEIISGEEEGKSAFKGVTTDNYSGKICVIDIGGGSTEFIYGDNAGIEFIKSLNMGAVRVKEKFFENDSILQN